MFAHRLDHVSAVGLDLSFNDLVVKAVALALAIALLVAVLGQGLFPNLVPALGVSVADVLRTTIRRPAARCFDLFNDPRLLPAGYVAGMSGPQYGMPMSGTPAARATVRYTRCTLKSANGLIAGPLSPPTMFESLGLRVWTSMAIARKVFTSDTASAPASSAARAKEATSVTFGVSFGMSGSGVARRTAALEILNSVQQGLASKLDFQAIIDLVGDKIQAIFDAQVVDIATYNRATDSLYSWYTIEKGQRMSIEGARTYRSYGFRQHVTETHEPLVINRDMDRLMEEYHNPVFVGEPVKSASALAAGIGGNRQRALKTVATLIESARVGADSLRANPLRTVILVLASPRTLPDGLSQVVVIVGNGRSDLSRVLSNVIGIQVPVRVIVQGCGQHQCRGGLSGRAGKELSAVITVEGRHRVNCLTLRYRGPKWSGSTAAKGHRRRYGQIDCVRCKDELIAPEKSEYRHGTHIRHLWHPSIQ